MRRALTPWYKFVVSDVLLVLFRVLWNSKEATTFSHRETGLYVYGWS